ncbi:hypothetical protein EG329_013751 [Mollisiaceae sp. DMI_Dod_QoI]|nr:hypothetical protein EG329_013751 [Helotiales sp. DMI_Dod_QoI]
MRLITSIIFFTFTLITSAQPPFDPSGSINVGNGVGRQFIDGQCLSDSDCGSACCANPTGICSTLDSAFSDGKTGCGFPSGAGPAIDPSGAANVGNGVGGQFIGGQCLSGADCGIWEDGMWFYVFDESFQGVTSLVESEDIEYESKELVHDLSISMTLALHRVLQTMRPQN